jgi:hypothetical protein
MIEPLVRTEMTVQEVIERWPATRAAFRRYGIPTEMASSPSWETIEQAAAANGHWAADRLVGELNQAAGGRANIQADAAVVQMATVYPATQAIFERYGIPCQSDCTPLWETIEQAAASRGHWADDSLLNELNVVCTIEFVLNGA